MKENRVSMVMCIYGDIKDLCLFLKDLEKQTYRNFEIIIVDQNKDEKVIKYIERKKFSYEIKYLTSEKGLSKSRNIGLKKVEGDIVCFPDDDCIYPERLLEQVNNFFQNEKYEGLIIRAQNSIKTGRKMHEKDFDQEVKINKIFNLVHSISLFMKKEIIESVGGFDENLGLGTQTIFQGQEDRDYPIRAIMEGYNFFYKREIEVFHPWDDPELDLQKDLIKRAFMGGASEMYVLNKLKFNNSFKIIRLIRKILAIIYFIFYKRNLYKAKASIQGLKGMLCYFKYKVK